MEKSAIWSEYLVIIPARSGSKGIKNKNLLEYKGETLLERTFGQALRLFDRDNIILSTDSKEYLEIINNRFKSSYTSLRGLEVSSDTASAMDVIAWELSKATLSNRRIKGIIYLQVTSPLRSDEDIRKAIEIFNQNECDVVASVSPADENPYFVHRRKGAVGFLEPLFSSVYKSRQEAPEVFKLNGSIFILNPSKVGLNELANYPRTIPYLMDRERSIDIDTLHDYNRLVDAGK